MVTPSTLPDSPLVDQAVTSSLLLLWHDAAQVADLRRRLAAGDEVLVAWLQFLRQQVAEVPLADALDATPDAKGQTNVAAAPGYAVAAATAYLLTQEAPLADIARQAALHELATWTPSDLGLAARSLVLAVVQQCCAGAWTADQLAEVNAVLRRASLAVLHLGKGNPHQVGNNWWAVSHCAALVAALAVQGQSPPAGNTTDNQLTAHIHWLVARIRPFLHHFGDAGLYHEGFGYQAYTTGFLLPAVLAARRCGVADFVAEFPGLTRMAESLFMTACERWNRVDQLPGEEAEWGCALSWNDAGQGWGQSALIGCSLGIAQPSQLPGLKQRFDVLHGHLAKRPNFGGGIVGTYFGLVHYPIALPSVVPGQGLATYSCDNRQGLVIARDAYRDGNDCIFGAYARSTHMGGHRHDDAGSIRLMALGHDWIMGGGQARGQSQFQSIITLADAVNNQPGNGTIHWLPQMLADQVAVGMDLRKVTGCYHDRLVAMRWPSEDHPAIMALLDLVDDHVDDRDIYWHQTFASHLDCQITANGFSLQADDGARFDLRFMASQPVEIRREEMPTSKRSFSSGSTVDFPGRPYIRARFAAQGRQHILAVATITKPDAAHEVVHDLQVTEAGCVLHLGDLTWRPFETALGPDFMLGSSGNISRFPAGDG